MCRTAPQVVAISLFVAMPCLELAVNAAESSGGVSKTSTRFAWEEALETLRQRQ